MRSPQTWLAWRADWHLWWAETHRHTVHSAREDARGFSSPEQEGVIIQSHTASAEARRLLKVAGRESDKVRHHLMRRAKLLDRLHASR